MIEIMVATAIIAILAEIALTNYIGYMNSARYSRTVLELQQISQEVDEYYLDHGRYPHTLGEVSPALAGVKDPWNDPYQYLSVADAKGKGQLRKDRSLVPVNSDYDLYSMGADQQSRPPFTAQVSQDDIVRANNGSYYGYVKDY